MEKQYSGKRTATFSSRLTDLMASKGLTKTDIARICNINKSNVTRYCNGEYVARAGVVYEMAAKLNVDPAWLMGYDVAMDGEDENFLAFSFEEATDILSRFEAGKTEILKNPPYGLKREDMEIAYAFHSLDRRTKDYIKSIINSKLEDFYNSLDGQK